MADEVKSTTYYNPPANSFPDKIKQLVGNIIESVIASRAGDIKAWISHTVTGVLEDIEPSAITASEPMLNYLLSLPNLPPEVVEYVTHVKRGERQVDGFMAVLIGMIASIPNVMNLSAVANQRNIQLAQAALRWSLPDLGTAVTLRQRGYFSDTQLQEIVAKSGLPDVWVQHLQHANMTLPDIQSIALAQFRGLITEQAALFKLKQLGFDDENAQLIQSMFPVIPPISDLIMMAVKEAFSPDIAQRFGQYEDFPEEVAQWAAKQGLSREWAQRYWAAHWDLPSATQGFEMFQRSIIEEDDLKLLLKSLDVMPFWRDKLIKIAYTPFTRVDIRRMYDENVITDEEVYRTYRDIGYDDWHAQKLTEWTVTQTRSANKELTKQELLTGYRRGLLTEGEARSRLQELGYKQEDIDYFIRYTDWQRTNDRTAPDKALAKGDLVTSYKQGVMSRQELLDALSNLGYDDTERAMIANLADAQMNSTKHEANKSLAKSEVINAYVDKIISRQECSTMLAQLGYDDDETEFIVALADFKITQNYRKDAVDLLHVQYVNGTLDDTQLVTQLNSLNLPDLSSQYYLYKWRLEREAKVVTPTFSQFAQMYKKNIVNEDEFRQALNILGYKEPYLSWMYELVTKSAPTLTVPS